MPKKRAVTNDVFASGRTVNVPQGAFGTVVKRTDDGFAPPRNPALPPRLGLADVTGQFVFSTVAGQVAVTAVGPDPGKVVGGDVQVVETDIVGRIAGTSMGDPSRMVATLECGLFGRIRGEDVTGPWRSLCNIASSGALVRLYGPLDRFGVQGYAWSLSMPSPSEIGFLPGGGQRMNHARFTVTLSQWTPPAMLGVSDSPEKRSRSRRRDYLVPGPTKKLAQDLVNGRYS